MSATMLFSVAYFMLNTLLVTAVPRLKRSEPQHASDLFGKFGWMGLAFGGSAAMGALLFLTFRPSGIGVLMAVAPILAMLPRRCTATSATRRRTRRCATRAPRPPNARPSRRSAICRRSRRASAAFTTRSRMPRSVWRRSRARPEATAPCLMLQAQAISAHRQAEDGLHHLAFQDSLTGLPNRRRFRELLVQVVHRIQERVRPTDIVARLGRRRCRGAGTAPRSRAGRARPRRAAASGAAPHLRRRGHRDHHECQHR